MDRDPRGRPSRARLYAGVAIVVTCMLGGWVFGLVVPGEGRRDLAAILWAIVFFWVGAIGSAVIVKAVLFRR